MNRQSIKVIVLIGAVLLALGTFLPVLEVPKRGAINLWDVDRAGVVVMVLAAAAAAVALLNRPRHAVWPGIGSLLVLAYAYQRVNAEIAAAELRLRDNQGEDPLGAVRDLVASSASIEYGWAVLAFGAIMVTAAGALGWRRR